MSFEGSLKEVKDSESVWKNLIGHWMGVSENKLDCSLLSHSLLTRFQDIKRFTNVPFLDRSFGVDSNTATSCPGGSVTEESATAEWDSESIVPICKLLTRPLRTKALGFLTHIYTLCREFACKLNAQERFFFSLSLSVTENRPKPITRWWMCRLSESQNSLLKLST